ncbi:replication-relaxation family protein [Amycolatopsis sp. NBC_01480]|uniref:replication-relaxation family protein n=1 Tax=Amycolatopsis sp. NBC_01480 TaxID=2903562 RepID=UPI002E29F40F|nr:replication-relaxation family protein [Amycolatopsis sp. NBC_01480]
MTPTPPPKRVRARHLAWVAERLSPRDWQVLETVNRLHLVTGFQVERLHFVDLAGRSRIVTRSRSLARLAEWRVLHRLPRRVGGAMRGSSVAVYGLGIAGQRLLAVRTNSSSNPPSVRPARVPSDRFVAHIVAVSELYVELREAERTNSLILRNFTTEPGAWWPNSRGGWLKPDAFLVTSNGRVDQLFWAEIDRATESLATIDRKLRTYVDFVNRGGLGPRSAVPRVLVTVPHEVRRAGIVRVVSRLPEPASELVLVTVDRDAVVALLKSLAGLPP